jgi:predicted KAP-like P-loop ATPase
VLNESDGKNMWPDNETDRDFLNFTGVADTVAEIVVQAEGRPISIGMSGAWGIGKSSMIKLVRRSLEQRRGIDRRDFVFVEFNAWLYQGYDDARAALMEVIGDKLSQEAKNRQKGTEKVWAFLQRIRWLRAAKLLVGSAAALHAGLPPVSLISEVLTLGKHAISGHVAATDWKEAGEVAAGVGKEAPGFLKPEEVTTPPKEIDALRKSFEEALEAMGSHSLSSSMTLTGACQRRPFRRWKRFGFFCF